MYGSSVTFCYARYIVEVEFSHLFIYRINRKSGTNAVLIVLLHVKTLKSANYHLNIHVESHLCTCIHITIYYWKPVVRFRCYLSFIRIYKNTTLQICIQ